jgi:hypothetical protein
VRGFFIYLWGDGLPETGILQHRKYSYYRILFMIPFGLEGTERRQAVVNPGNFFKIHHDYFFFAQQFRKKFINRRPAYFPGFLPWTHHGIADVGEHKALWLSG